MSGRCFILFAYVLYVGIFKIVDTQDGQPIKSTVNNINFTRSPAIPDRKMCGFQEPHKMPQLRIVGGTETSLKEHPWMALLGYKTRYGEFKWKCGGTLISQRYVLTAAHCVTGQIVPVVGNLTYVKFGLHNRNKEASCDIHGNCNEKAVIRGIESVSFHKDYDTTVRISSGDIAVIRLNQTVEYSTYIRPICLAEPYEESKTNDRLTVVGWGQTETCNCSQVKLKADVPVLTNQYCNHKYYGLTRLDDSQICAGGEQGRDTCNADSGGPLLRLIENGTQWYQEGIISGGTSDCGQAGLPGIYTKVSSFLSWIHSHVKE
ncbi:phenoloxidase-activating factor 1-like [Diabrotica virgifera virgifera]|uniref:Peptidase S1 domain-containing protein n=2 Tax=Diabrotica virgifera virgifera TaxID=50390 RepID=A0ABM5KNX5_DIAVI|nr:phenoloxidase-activating factor 1-like [Diabrotica virgifera virgifera]